MKNTKDNIQGRINIARTSLLYGLAISAFCFILTCIITPLEWDFYDGFLSHLINGIATRGVLSKFYIYGFFQIPKLYLYLQHIAGDVPWIGIITLFFLVTANTLFVSCVLFHIKNRHPSLTFMRVFLFSVPLFFIIQFPVISRPSHTGLSFLLCGSALLFITTCGDGITGFRKVIMYVVLALIYFWGICIRLESGIGASIIVILFIVLISKQRILSLLKISPLLLVGLLTGIAIVSTLDSIPFLKKTEASLFYVSDGVNQGNIFDGLSVRDSVKVQAVKRFFINDEKEITESFINDIARRKAAQEIAHPIEITQRLRKAWEIGHVAITAQYLVILINLLLLILIFLTDGRKISILLFQIGFWAITFGLAYSVKLEERHFLYMLEIYTYCNIALLAYNFSILYERPLLLKLFYSIVVLIFLNVIYIGHERSAIVSEKLHRYDMAEKEVNLMAKDKILLLDGDSKFIFHGGPFTVRHFPAPKEIVFYDMGELPILTQYNAYLDKLCSCNSRQVPVFYDYLLKNKGDVLIISTDSRNRFIQSYMKVIYNRDIRFNILNGKYEINAISPSDEHLNYYTISD